MVERRMESADERLKRLKIRAWRRGTREMDLILGAFADRELAAMTAAELDLFEQVLAENDHDLYGWISGAAAGPAAYAGLFARLRAAVAPRTASS